MQRVHADLGKSTNTVTDVNSDECPRTRRVVKQVFRIATTQGTTRDL